ncbi:hypothetical protein ABKV19_004897 [Rosa sericea]
MEDSLNSMMEKARSSSESPEESSWTMYLEDFLTNSHHHDDQQHSSSFSSGYENHSIVSDAASSISKNLSNICNEEVLGFSNRSSPSCIIKRKAKKALLHDDALEDTATSPVNSPKVCNLYHSADMKQNLQNDNRDIISKVTVHTAIKHIPFSSLVSSSLLHFTFVGTVSLYFSPDGRL